jgi:hypothetical protein
VAEREREREREETRSGEKRNFPKKFVLSTTKNKKNLKN